MKRILILIILVFVGSAGWRIGNTLSSDAISMAVGIFFGVLAGIPAALLVLASERRRPDRPQSSRGMADHAMSYQQTSYPPSGGQHQPPVIILNGGGQPTRQPHGYPPQLSDASYRQNGGIEMAGWPQEQRPPRRFKVVGEQEEWLE